MNKNSNMRLQRESRKVKKDFESQIKKHGKIIDNYVCAPDPEDPLIWYFVVFGLDDDYKGGYYCGKVVCPDTYPAMPPYIMLATENGCFEQNEKICLSITDYHLESWNPAWTVSHIIIGLISFWLDDEETAGSLYYWAENNKTYHRQMAAWQSREAVLKDKNFKRCLEYYKPFIGICDEQNIEDKGAEFIKISEELEKKAKEAAEVKRVAEELIAKQKAEEEAKAKVKEEEAKQEAEAKAKQEAEQAQVAAIVNENAEKVVNKLANFLDKYTEEQLPCLEQIQVGPINLNQVKSQLVEQGAELFKNLIKI